MIFEIGIVNYAEIALGFLECGAESCALALVTRVSKEMPIELPGSIRRQVLREALQDNWRCVARTIIHHDHLDPAQQGRIAKHRKAPQACFYQVLFVVHRHANGEAGALARVVGQRVGGARI